MDYLLVTMAIVPIDLKLCVKVMFQEPNIDIKILNASQIQKKLTEEPLRLNSYSTGLNSLNQKQNWNSFELYFSKSFEEICDREQPRK